MLAVEVNVSRVFNAHLIIDCSAVVADLHEVTMINGGGRTLMPGFIDMHLHSAYVSIQMQKWMVSDHAYHLLVGAKNHEYLSSNFNLIMKDGVICKNRLN